MPGNGFFVVIGKDVSVAVPRWQCREPGRPRQNASKMFSSAAKIQISNPKSQTSPRNPNSNPRGQSLVLEFKPLEFVWDLGFGIWIFQSGLPSGVQEIAGRDFRRLRLPATARR